MVNADYSVLNERIEPSHTTFKFKFGVRFRINKYKNAFSKGFTENLSREIFIIDSAFKINLWTYKIKDLNGEKSKEVFMKKNFCSVNYK